MIILKDAYVLTFSQKNGFGRYSILIDEDRIVDITRIEYPPKAEDRQTKVNRWIERYSSNVEVIDCSSKIIMPTLVNSCLKSEGSLIKYLLRNRGYEKSDEFIYTDFMFNYIYQDLQSEELRKDISNIYNYSFSKNLKSGIQFLNEFSLRKDIGHLELITNSQKITNQKVNVCYPIKQDEHTLESFGYLNPAYYLTEENQLTIYDISQLTEQKKNNKLKLFLEVSTNKEVVDKFRQTFNKPIIVLLAEYGLIDDSTSFINPIYLTYDEIKIIAEKKANIIICPKDLLYFSNRYFPIDEFINHGVKYSIATGWLGDDLFKEVRIFRNKYKELNFTSEDLLFSLIKTPRELYFHESIYENEPFGFAPNKIADMVFFDLTDVRFQLLPENFTYEKICDFIIDNFSSINISDVMINGNFKIRNNKAVDFDENEIIEEVLKTRKNLYKIGKYKEISDRTAQRENIEQLGLGNRKDDEIKLFPEAGSEEIVEEQSNGVKDEFRIKGKLPIFRRKIPASQKSLFDDSDSGTIIQVQDIKETPEINLLFTELDDLNDIDNEVTYSRIADAKILKQAGLEKKQEKENSQKHESKIELPKDVKLKFGGD